MRFLKYSKPHIEGLKNESTPRVANNSELGPLVLIVFSYLFLNIIFPLTAMRLYFMCNGVKNDTYINREIENEEMENSPF